MPLYIDFLIISQPRDVGWSVLDVAVSQVDYFYLLIFKGLALARAFAWFYPGSCD